jgi:hypothetical protein
MKKYIGLLTTISAAICTYLGWLICHSTLGQIIACFIFFCIVWVMFYIIIVTITYENNKNSPSFPKPQEWDKTFEK